jgi:hypothetical protein
MQHRTIYALCSLKYFLLINWVYTDLTSRISPTTIICSLRLHWQVNFDYTFRFTPTTLSDSLQIHSFVHSAYTSKLTLTTSLYLLPLQLLVHSDLAILEPFFSITPVGRFWLVKTSIWMTPFRFESSCARDGGMWWIILHRGDHIWSFFRRGAGNFFTMSHTATREASWPYMDFWTFKFCVTSIPVWGYAPIIWEMGVSMALYGNAATPQCFRVHKTDHTLLLTCVSSK